MIPLSSEAQGRRAFEEQCHSCDRQLVEKMNTVDLQLQLDAQEQDALLVGKMFDFFDQYQDCVVTRIALYRERAWGGEDERRDSSTGTSTRKGKAPEDSHRRLHQTMVLNPMGISEPRIDKRERELVWSSSDASDSGTKVGLVQGTSVNSRIPGQVNHSPTKRERSTREHKGGVFGNSTSSLIVGNNSSNLIEFDRL